MTFSYVRGNPDNLVGGGAAAMGDIQGPFYDIRDYLNAPAPDQAPLVTNLPTGTEGQECVYHPTIARRNGANLANDAYWHMRYINAKWRMMGGGRYIATIPGQFAIPAPGLGGSFLSLKTRIQIPAPGLWRVGAIVRISSTSPSPPSVGMFTLMTGISDNAGSASQWADVGSAPTAAGAGGAVSGDQVWNAAVGALNFESWIISPGFLTPGVVEYGSIWLEPLAL